MPSSCSCREFELTVSWAGVRCIEQFTRKSGKLSEPQLASLQRSPQYQLSDEVLYAWLREELLSWEGGKWTPQYQSTAGILRKGSARQGGCLQGRATDKCKNLVVLRNQRNPPAQQYFIAIYNVFGSLADSYVSIYIPQNKTQEDFPEDITNTTGSSPLYQGTASKSID